MIRKKIKYLLIFFISFIGIAILLWFLFCFNLFSGENGYSGSLEEAENLGVLLAEYKPNKDSIKIFNDEYFSFKVIWLENWWIEGNRCKRVMRKVKDSNILFLELPHKNYNLLNKYFHSNTNPAALRSRNTEIEYFGEIGVNKRRFLTFSYNKNAIDSIIHLEVITPSDLTEIRKVPPLWTNPIVIDSFYLIKK